MNIVADGYISSMWLGCLFNKIWGRIIGERGIVNSFKQQVCRYI